MKIEWTECNIIPGKFALKYNGDLPAFFIIKMKDNERDNIELSILKVYNGSNNSKIGIIDGSFAYDFDNFATIISYCKVEE